MSPGIASLFFKIKKLVGNHLQERQQNPGLSISEKSEE